MFFKPEDAVDFKGGAAQEVLAIAKKMNFKNEGGVITVPLAKAVLDHIATLAVERNFPWWKKMRPHDVIPSIQKFKAPAGDYSVGVEHETYVRGDDDLDARKEIVDWLANEDYVCIDSDGAGGRVGAKVMLEATFPPVLASECNMDWAAARYVKFLGDKKLVKPSDVNTVNVGVHINMAKGGADPANWCRYGRFDYGTPAQAKKYFGRGGGISMQVRNNHFGNRWLEFRMFNTTTDPKQLLWYVEVCKILIDIMDRGEDGVVNVWAILEEAYNKFFGVAKAKKAA